MAAFSTLSFELLRCIVDCCGPYDFESLALTCKGLHAACSPLFSRHNSLRRHYRRFRFVNADDRKLDPSKLTKDDVWTIPELLSNIAANPIIAEYIVDGDFEDRLSLESVRDGSQGDMRAVIRRMEQQDEVDRLRGLVKQSKYLAQLNCDTDAWFDRILADTNEWNDDQDFPVCA